MYTEGWHAGPGVCDVDRLLLDPTGPPWQGCETRDLEARPGPSELWAVTASSSLRCPGGSAGTQMSLAQGELQASCLLILVKKRRVSCETLHKVFVSVVILSGAGA